MKRTLFLLLSSLFSIYINSQSNIISIYINSDNDFDICGDEGSTIVTITNPSPFNVTNVVARVNLPPKVHYSTNSISGGTEQNITNLLSPVFSIPNIPPGGSHTFGFKYSTSCDILPDIKSGATFRNTVSINFQANSLMYSDSIIGSQYGITSPNLAITNISNQTYSGNVGDVFQRCFTITNNGNSALFGDFKLKHKHNGSIRIVRTDVGSISINGDSSIITITDSNYSSLGNLNDAFEPGESIIICETIEILNCNNTNSTYEYMWGCEGDTCQRGIDFGSVIFPTTKPDLKFNYSQQSSDCLDGTDTFSIQITNVGQGTAVNFSSTIDNQHGTLSSINAGSISITNQNGQNVGGTPNVIDANSGGSASCFGPKRNYQFTYLIDSIKPGDTVTITWQRDKCCKPVNCGRTLGRSWRDWSAWTDICGQRYSRGVTYRYRHLDVFMGIIDNGSSTNFSLGNSQGNIKLKMNNYRKGYSGDGKIRFEISLPNCLRPSGNVSLKGSNGMVVNALSTNHDSVTGKYVVSFPTTTSGFSWINATIDLDLGFSCPCCSGAKDIGVEVFFEPDNCSTCPFKLSCLTIPVNLVCPKGTCLLPYSNKVERYNYGLPDNNNDGIPDTSGVLDMSKVNRNLASFGDTIISQYTSRVNNGLDDWKEILIEEEISNGRIFFDTLLAQIDIIRGTTIYSCKSSSLTLNYAGNTSNVSATFDIQQLILKGCLPNNFSFQKDDTIRVRFLYKVIGNSANGAYTQISFRNRMSAIVRLTPRNTEPRFDTIFRCNSPLLPDSTFKRVKKINNDTTFIVYTIEAIHTNGNNYLFGDTISIDTIHLRNIPYEKETCISYVNVMNMVGFYIVNVYHGDYLVQGCTKRRVAQNFGMALSANKFWGSNQYPFEYRPFYYLDTLIVTIPKEWNPSDFRLTLHLSRGSSRNTKTFSISPNSISNTGQYMFLTETYFKDSLHISDEGFLGTIDFLANPNCKIEDEHDSIYSVYYETIYKNVERIDGNNLNNKIRGRTQNRDILRFQKPNLKVTPILPTIQAYGKYAEWELLVFNQNGSGKAYNVWLYPQRISGLDIIRIFDITNNSILSPDTNGFYRLGDFHNDSARYRIFGEFNTCDLDSVRLFYSYDCDEYPTHLDSGECVEPINLYGIPVLSELDNLIKVQNGVVGLCDTFEVEAEASNILLGSAYKLSYSIKLPQGMQFLSGSGMISYPDSTSYISIPDPILQNTLLVWNMDSLLPIIDSLGLSGTLDLSKNTIYIKFKTTAVCGYSSGDKIESYFEGESNCKKKTNTAVALSNDLYLNGVNAAFFTRLNIIADHITPCLTANPVTISIYNYGPQTSSNNDTISIDLPLGVNYIPSSIRSIYNWSNVTPPIIINNGNSQTLKWKVPNTINVQDSALFRFSVLGNEQLLKCEKNRYRAVLNTYSTAICSTTGQPCNIGIVTGSNLREIFNYKGYLQIDSVLAIATPLPPNGEQVNVRLKIFNAGQTISAGKSIYVDYYYDADNSGALSPADILLANDSINHSIGANGFTYVNSSFYAPAGQSCNIIAVLDENKNACSCIGNQIAFSTEFKYPLSDTVICNQTPINIGSPAISTYRYSWSPSTYLSNSNSSSPTFYKQNPNTIIIDTNKLYYSVDRIGCSSNDSMNVYIYAEPIADAGMDIRICDTNVTNISANQPYASGYGRWSVDTSANNPSGIIFLNTNNPQTTVYNLKPGAYSLVWSVYHANCEPARDTVRIDVMNSNNIYAGPDQTICISEDTVSLNANAPLFGANSYWNVISHTGAGVGSYSFDDSTVHNTVIRNLTAGTYGLEYSIQGGTCQDAFDTLLIEVIDMPNPFAGADQILCDIDTTFLNANKGIGEFGYWTFDTASTRRPYPTIHNLYSNSTMITDILEGEHYFIWNLYNNYCPTVRDTVLVDIYDSQKAVGGPDIDLCGIYNYQLQANPAQRRGMGYWKIDSTNTSPNYPTIVDSSIYNTRVNNLQNGKYTFIWQIENGACPVVGDTVIWNINPKPEVNISAKIDEVCENTCVEFENIIQIDSPDSITYAIWDFGNGNISNDTTDIIHCYTKEGVFNVSLIVRSNNNCYDTAYLSKSITVKRNPIADFSINPANPHQYERISIFDLSTGADSYEYWFGDGSTSTLAEPFNIYNDTGRYIITQIVTNQDNCTDTISKYIYISEGTSFFTPNVITLNNDGKNDYFKPVMRGVNPTNYRLRIYDRWGKLFFETTDPNQAWDGRYKGTKVPQDAYVWKIDYSTIFSDDMVQKIGHIVVLH